MYAYNFNLSNTTAQEVIGVLKATGSSDPDVLNAAYQDFRRNFATQKITGLILLIVGAVSTLTIVLIPVSVPAAVFGWWYWKKGIRNLDIVESTYRSYVAPLGGSGISAVA